MIKDLIISVFKSEFHFLQDKFEVLELLDNNSKMDFETIDMLKLPTDDYNVVWHPGVYLFLGNNSVYRVGVSMRNSRARVLQHLEACTSKNDCSIWDIDKYEDKSILLFNVKDKADRHWLLAVEAFFEDRFKPLINAGRIG
jgi:hypothetical protein